MFLLKLKLYYEFYLIFQNSNSTDNYIIRSLYTSYLKKAENFLKN